MTRDIARPSSLAIAPAILVIGVAAAVAFAGGSEAPSLPPQATGQLARQQYTSPNRKIDYEAFLSNALAVSKLREERRVSEADFIEMSREPDTIVFDARSDVKYRLLHVKGAKHLSLPDVTAAELAKLIPSKTTRILIYCNNNFANEPEAFPTKAVSASLNLYTFNTLYSYGYANVYELGPLIDVKSSKIPFDGSKQAR
jgi:hypothetical protein